MKKDKEMKTKFFETNLEMRMIPRGEDEDYFIETLSYPINLELTHELMSRIQFPKSRAVLVRTSPYRKDITIHIMRDVDLYSSFANFEIDLTDTFLQIQKEEGYIRIFLEKDV